MKKLAVVLFVALLALTSNVEASAINDARIGAGADPLTLDYTLQAYAQAHAEVMATRGTLEHSTQLSTLLPGRTWLGENVGRCVGCTTLPADHLIGAFNASPGHAAVLYSNIPNTYGEGIAVTSSGVYITQVFGATLAAPRFDAVARLYWAVFLRPGDAAGLRYWREMNQRGVSLEFIANYFATSPEFQAKYGNLYREEFIDRVYLNVLGRPDADAAGWFYWWTKLQDGLTRGEMVLYFSESVEFKHKVLTGQVGN